MVIQEFSYFSPKSIEEACSLLYQYGDDAKALAGGQSLIPLMKLNLIQAQKIVDLKRIPGMSFISLRDENSALEIGALEKHSEIASSLVVKKFTPILADNAAGIGHPLIRNRGTIGGSICHCDPAADYGPTMLVLDAEMSVASMGGSRRKIPAADFFRGLFETALTKGEILETIVIPIPNKSRGYSVKKLTLGHGDFPLLNVSVLLTYDAEARRFRNVAIALGGVGEKAFRLPDAEKVLLESSNPQVDDFDLAARITQDKANPQSDIDVSAEYKKKMVGVITRRALVEAFERSRSSA
jgi:carbon-monoxide dehydrogenase medium subunit